MKKYCFLIICFILILTMLSFETLPTASFCKEEDNTCKKLLDIMEKIEAEPYELKITSWIKLNKSNISRETMEKYLDLALREFKFNTIDKNWMNEENIKSLHKIVKIKEQNAVIDAAVQQIDKKTYIIINIEGVYNEKCLEWELKLKKYYSFFNAKPEIANNIVGKLAEKMTAQEQKRLIENIFSMTGSSIIEGITTDNVVSYSGWCPDLKQELIVKNNKININVAVHNHELEDIAYVYIGTPVLTCEY